MTSVSTTNDLVLFVPMQPRPKDPSMNRESNHLVRGGTPGTRFVVEVPDGRSVTRLLLPAHGASYLLVHVGSDEVGMHGSFYVSTVPLCTTPGHWGGLVPSLSGPATFEVTLRSLGPDVYAHPAVAMVVGPRSGTS